MSRDIDEEYIKNLLHHKTEHEKRLAVLNLLATETRKARREILQLIADNNFDDLHNTYDFDGLAENVLSQLEALKGVKE